MSGNDGALWTFFITGALSVAVVLVAMSAVLVIAQRRTIALHRRYAQELLRAQEAERAHVGRELHCLPTPGAEHQEGGHCQRRLRARDRPEHAGEQCRSN